MARSKQTSVGRAGEYLAATLLEMAGIEVYRVDGDFDLILNLKGRLIRMEVKSASIIEPLKNRYRFYPVRKEDADVYAFVAIPMGLMRIFWGDDLNYNTQKNMSAKLFTQEAQDADIARLWQEFSPAQGETAAN